jgi:serine/threonine-protein kinase
LDPRQELAAPAPARSAGEPRPTHPGAELGPYVVGAQIGRGGMGAVFEGRHKKLDRRVAIKVMDPRVGDDRWVERFVREGRTVAQLAHPHVVSVFDVGEEGGHLFLVMELLEGETLAQHVRERAPLSPHALADVMLPVLSAVSAAHEKGIIHRDLKPENIMLARRRHGELDPVVLDFGISKQLGEQDDSLTGSGALLGSVHYMAPELTRNAKLASDLSDVYALGAVLYACATGRVPFTGESVYEIMHAIATSPLPPPSAMNPSLPRELDALVLRAMARDPKARYSSVAELGNALLVFAGPKATALWSAEFAPADEPVPPAVSPSSPRRSVWPWALTALALVLVGATGLRSARREPDVASPPAVVHAAPSEGPRASSDPAPPRPAPPPAASEPPREAVVAARPASSGHAPRLLPHPRRADAPTLPSASQPHARPPDEVGTNGAPIYE